MKGRTIMRRFVTGLVFSAAFLPAFGNADEEERDRAERLLGGNENPPVISEGTGRFTATSEGDRIAFKLSYDVASDESDVLQAHLHIANPGTNGPIVVFLCSNPPIVPPDGVTQRGCPPSPGEVTGDILAADVLAASTGDPVVDIIAAGDLEGLKRLIEQSAVYVNVHTDDHPGGEIRGQMNPRRR
jgi:CHRD domain